MTLRHLRHDSHTACSCGRQQGGVSCQFSERASSRNFEQHWTVGQYHHRAMKGPNGNPCPLPRLVCCLFAESEAASNSKMAFQAHLLCTMHVMVGMLTPSALALLANVFLSCFAALHLVRGYRPYTWCSTLRTPGGGGSKKGGKGQRAEKGGKCSRVGSQ